MALELVPHEIFGVLIEEVGFAMDLPVEGFEPSVPRTEGQDKRRECQILRKKSGAAG